MITDLLDLQSILIKCLECLVACKPRLDVQDYLDPFQYAYSHGRGTYDAVNIVVHLILKHIDKPKAYAKTIVYRFYLVVQPYPTSHLAGIVQLVKVNQTLS